MQNDFMQAIALAFPQRQLAVNVLHHDDRAVDHDAKIDGSDRKQIGGAIMGVEHDEGKQQRSGIVSAAMMAARTLTRKKIRTISTRIMPWSRLCSTVSVVSFTSSLRS